MGNLDSQHCLSQATALPAPRWGSVLWGEGWARSWPAGGHHLGRNTGPATGLPDTWGGCQPTPLTPPPSAGPPWAGPGGGWVTFRGGPGRPPLTPPATGWAGRPLISRPGQPDGAGVKAASGPGWGRQVATPSTDHQANHPSSLPLLSQGGLTFHHHLTQSPDPGPTRNSHDRLPVN